MKHREALDDSDDDDGPQDDDAWLYEDLKVLGHLYSRLKDREQLIALIFEVSCFTRSWVAAQTTFMLGLYLRVAEGYHNDILLPSSTSLPGG